MIRAALIALLPAAAVAEPVIEAGAPGIPLSEPHEWQGMRFPGWTLAVEYAGCVPWPVLKLPSETWASLGLPDTPLVEVPDETPAFVYYGPGRDRWLGGGSVAAAGFGGSGSGSVGSSASDADADVRIVVVVDGCCGRCLLCPYEQKPPVAPVPLPSAAWLLAGAILAMKSLRGGGRAKVSSRLAGVIPSRATRSIYRR